MQLTYSSVTAFFKDLEAHLLTVGFTPARDIGVLNRVFYAGFGTFFRIQQKSCSSTVTAIGMGFGDDADILATTDIEPERCLPFDTSAGGEFSPGFFWNTTEQVLALCVTGGDNTRCYRVEYRIRAHTKSIFHQDRQAPQFEPNFKDTSGPYIPAGA